MIMLRWQKVGMKRERKGPWLPEEDQTIFDFVEKFGSGNERPVPLPKMWNEEVGPPEWARQYLEEAKKKKKVVMMEKTRSDLPRLEEEEGSGEEKRRDLKNGGEGGDEKEG